MKVFVKIFILVLAISLAIGGVMVYAKTRVEPPVKLKQVDQYQYDLNGCYSSIMTAKSHKEVDMLYLKTVNRIKIFEEQNAISSVEANKQYDMLIDCYAPKFIARCMTKFENSEWIEKDHAYMLTVISRLNSVKHSDNTSALSKEKTDSLNLIRTIIDNYRKAKSVTFESQYEGITHAKNTIAAALKYSSDEYLSKCTNLRNALASVKSKIASSHYNYIESQVEKLSHYRYYGKDYYENSLIPMVDECVTQYEENAKSIYGFKKDVDILWNRARSYYNEASNYYNQENY